MRPILDQTDLQLRTWMLEHDQRPYRAAQIRKWLFEKRADSWDQMTDLPRELREQLASEFDIWSAQIAIHRQDDDGTEKLLLTLANDLPSPSARAAGSEGNLLPSPASCTQEEGRGAGGEGSVLPSLTSDTGKEGAGAGSEGNLLPSPSGRGAGGEGSPPVAAPNIAITPSKAPSQIECVLLRDDKGHCSMCISTQVGCAMKCAFCATGLGGMTRNLTTGEIIEQMLQLQRLLKPEERLSHVVCMGMGEPLANLDRLMPALAAASAKDGLGIGVRKITISTVGLPVGIRRLAEQNCQYHLAVSLHAPNDELRTQLMPTNRHIGIDAIMAAADEYFEKTGRRVTYEYILLAGVNDGPTEAQQMVALLRGRPSLVNLIPYNPVRGLKFHTPHPSAVARFIEILEQGGLNVAIRHRKGARIDAACGQLRRSVTSVTPPIRVGSDGI